MCFIGTLEVKFFILILLKGTKMCLFVYLLDIKFCVLFSKSRTDEFLISSQYTSISYHFKLRVNSRSYKFRVNLKIYSQIENFKSCGSE